MSITSSVAELSSAAPHPAAGTEVRRRPALLVPGMLLRMEGAVLALVAVALIQRVDDR